MSERLTEADVRAMLGSLQASVTLAGSAMTRDDAEDVCRSWLAQRREIERLTAEASRLRGIAEELADCVYSSDGYDFRCQCCYARSHGPHTATCPVRRLRELPA